MANFNDWLLPGKRRFGRLKDGTYNDDYNDTGNWSSNKVGVGSFIGTNRSISAPTLASWRGRPVTATDMKNLSREEAIQIYKAKYWDDINADQINDQTLAEFLADMKSSAGSNGLKAMQKALNKAGENIPVDGNFGTRSREALNRQIRKNKANIYNLFRAEMIYYYQNQAKGKYANWIKSLDRDYPEMPEETNREKSAKIFIVLLAVAVAIWYFFFRTKSSVL
jgi:lysozyme family protein